MRGIQNQLLDQVRATRSVIIHLEMRFCLLHAVMNVGHDSTMEGKTRGQGARGSHELKFQEEFRVPGQA